ncbi:MAG TPA: transglutaminase domain-containing protein, partial [Chthonomonadaceae bacterium]|nr:transglutaminase domain-containing protein [Chthonomonadaceae bacterium]
IAATTGLVRSERKLFAGQFGLAIVCVVCAFVLANVVAIPMHWFGHSLSLAQGWGQAATIAAKAAPFFTGGLGNDDKTLSIATGPVLESDAAVMHVQSAEPFKWRGATFDYYTGSGFENRLATTRKLAASDEARDLQQLKQFRPVDGPTTTADMATYRVPRSQVDPPGRGERAVQQTVRMLVGNLNQCYAAGSPVSISVARDASLTTSDNGAVSADQPLAANAEYRITSVVPTEDVAALRAASTQPDDVPAIIADHYLQISHGNSFENPKLRRIAADATAGLTNNYEKARAIAAYIARTCKYNLDSPAAPQESDRVEHFLTVSQQGYCDSFAAAMTMLARYSGIPARIATGYLAGKEDGLGGYVVRSDDKHAWAELYFSGVGWVPFDATEGTVDITDRSRHGHQQQSGFLAWLTSHGALPPLIALVLVGLMAYLAVTELLPRLRGSRDEAAGATAIPATNIAVIQAYLDSCATLESRGLRRGRSATPSEFLETAGPGLGGAAPPAAEALASLTALHDRYRYGRVTATQPEADQAKALSAAIRAALSRVSRKALAGT